jgi:hypothetical protein
VVDQEEKAEPLNDEELQTLRSLRRRWVRSGQAAAHFAKKMGRLQGRWGMKPWKMGFGGPCGGMKPWKMGFGGPCGGMKPGSGPCGDRTSVV